MDVDWVLGHLCGVAVEGGLGMSDYNGWTNYETWLVNLWITNDQGSYEVSQDMAREAWEERQASAYATAEQEAKYVLAGKIKDWVEEMVDHEVVSPSGLVRDLVTGALGEVNWGEIAGSWLEGVKEEV